jgi:hypothetical protein
MIFGLIIHRFCVKNFHVLKNAVLWQVTLWQFIYKRTSHCWVGFCLILVFRKYWKQDKHDKHMMSTLHTEIALLCSSLIILWLVRQKQLSVFRFQHSGHSIMLLNRSPLLCNGRVNNVSARAVTSCNNEAAARSGVFYAVWHEAATIQWDTWCHVVHINRRSVFCAVHAEAL